MFWYERELEALTPSEWGQLCDGCGKCCLNKLEDPHSKERVYTRVACHMLDISNCQCSDYEHRQVRVPECIQVTPEMARSAEWLPDSCSYRLVAQGQDLPAWHPLVSGDPQSTVTAGQSVAGRVLSEAFVHPDGLDEHIITWVNV